MIRFNQRTKTVHMSGVDLERITEKGDPLQGLETEALICGVNIPVDQVEYWMVHFNEEHVAAEQPKEKTNFGIFIRMDIERSAKAFVHGLNRANENLDLAMRFNEIAEKHGFSQREIQLMVVAYKAGLEGK
ncbi:MAG: hypothetical protein ACYCX4_03840 [Bacillota bacterium]